MILVLGSGLDRVYPKVLACLAETAHPFATVDEDCPTRYSVKCDQQNGHPVFRIFGGDCDGSRQVGSIFVRHAVARTMDQEHLACVGQLQAALNRMLLFAGCSVINHPASAYSNYSKAYQVELLARSGFDVPRTLLTNVPDEARSFCEELDGNVIFKGASNMMTLAQVMTPDHLPRLEMLPYCPTIFQEYVAGVDYRVHVVGDDAFVTRIITRDEDYRRSSLISREDIASEAADLPQEVIAKCVEFTKDLGLIASGIDFKETPAGRLVALECNPYPQFTFYEGLTGQPITRAVIDYLVRHETKHATVFA